jgi:hypothetical protein
MAMILVLLFPALGFTGAGLLAVAIYRYENKYHGTHETAPVDDTGEFEFIMFSDEESRALARHS